MSKLHAVPLARRLLSHLAGLDLPAGAHLPEDRLGRALGLSRTPIRRGLQQLSAVGVVRGERHRGFFLVAPSRDIFPAAVAMPEENDGTLLERIAADRLRGDLGEALAEADLVGRYGISRRTAKRVLGELGEDGLVEAAGGGWRFNPALLTREAIEASYRFRLAIEPAIPLLPTFRPLRDEIDRCREDHLRLLSLPPRERTPRATFRVDAGFHDLLARFGNNAFFASAVGQQNRMRQLMEYREPLHERRAEVWAGEHLAVLDAAERGDLLDICTSLRQHLLNALGHGLSARLATAEVGAGEASRAARPSEIRT